MDPPSTPPPPPSCTRRRADRVVYGGLLTAVMACSFATKSIPAAVIGLLLPPGTAMLAIAGYLGLGAMGLPVYAGFRAGAGHLFGPDGGFILAPLFQAPVTSALFRRRPGTSWAKLALPLLAGFLVHLVMGTVGTVVLGAYPLDAALGAAALTAPWVGLKVLIVGALYRAVAPRLPASLRPPAPPPPCGDA